MTRHLSVMAMQAALDRHATFLGTWEPDKLPAEAMCELLLDALHWCDAHDVILDDCLTAAENAFIHNSRKESIDGR